MNRYAISFLALSLCIILARRIEAQSEYNDVVNKKVDIAIINVTKPFKSDRTLKLSYEIRNKSQQDVWICDSVSQGYNFEVYLDEDSQTLMVRKRLDVPSSSLWYSQPFGKYIRLRPGEKRIESLLLNVPVNPVHMYYESSKRLHRVINATRLSIEIGYYLGNLPEIFIDILKETEKTDLDKMILLNHWFGGVLGFNHSNEQFRHRDEEVLIPYTQQKLNNEKVLRTIIDDLSIPYKESIRHSVKYNIPDLTTCTRVKIQCEPSILEYFYPYYSQQDLLSKAEMEYLQSEKSIAVEDSQKINDFANEIKQEEHGTGGIVSEKNKANVICYRDGRRVTSFIVYDNSSIETKQKQRIKYFNGLVSMRMFTPQIQPFELRMQCAANLKNLWHRLRFYDRAEKTRVQSYSNIKLYEPNKLDYPNKKDAPDVSDMDKIEEELFQEAQLFFEAAKKRMADLYPKIKLIYPISNKWCDAMEWAFVGPRIRSKRHEAELKMKVHVCPSVSQGLSTYAMNPDCKADSPADVVLLFETKGGWNQHGGPELFTFDNHDPKGGCVLLNDGTVKFIRTTEELQQLRWK